MPVVMTQVLPPEVTLEMARRVTDEADAAGAEGLIAHAAVHDDEAGAIRLIGIWETQEAFERFSRQHVAPAARRVAAEAGIQSPLPQTRLAETVIFVRGR